MKRDKTIKRSPLPQPYLKDLENRVFGALAITPERPKRRSLSSPTPVWSIAASFLVMMGSYFYFKTNTELELQDLESAQIADYLSYDYEASIFLDNQLGTLEDPFILENTQDDFDSETLTTYFNNDTAAYWINEMNENEK